MMLLITNKPGHFLQINSREWQIIQQRESIVISSFLEMKLMKLESLTKISDVEETKTVTFAAVRSQGERTLIGANLVAGELGDIPSKIFKNLLVNLETIRRYDLHDRESENS